MPILPQPALRSYLQQTLISSQVKSVLLLLITILAIFCVFPCNPIFHKSNYFYHTTVPKAHHVLNKPAIYHPQQTLAKLSFYISKVSLYRLLDEKQKLRVQALKSQNQEINKCGEPQATRPQNAGATRKGYARELFLHHLSSNTEI